MELKRLQLPSKQKRILKNIPTAVLKEEGTGQEEFVIKNVALITSGEALGHGLWTDTDFIEKTATLGQAMSIGVKARFGHPDMSGDAIGTELGRFRNLSFYIAEEASKSAGYEVAVCVGDFHPMRTQKNASELDHILQASRKDPQILGTSITFMPGGLKTESGRQVHPCDRVYIDTEEAWDEKEDPLLRDNPKGLPHETIEQLYCCDFVDSPANNPNGIYGFKSQGLSKGPTNTYEVMRKALTGDLEALKSVASYLQRTINPASLGDSDLITQNSSDVKDVKTKNKAGYKGTAETSDGVTVGFPGDVPMIGDPVTEIDPETGEETGAAPDGTHELPSLGQSIEVAGGQVTAITAMAAEEEAQENEEGTEGSESVRSIVQSELAPMQKQMKGLKGQLAKQRKLAADTGQELEALKQENEKLKQENEKLAKAPATRTDTHTPDVEDSHQNTKSGKMPKEFSTEVLDGVKTLFQARAEERATGKQIVKQATQKASYTGADMSTESIAAIKDVFGEIFDLPYLLEDVESLFSVTRHEVAKNGSLNVVLPNMDDEPGDNQYIKPGIGCSYTSDGKAIFDQREMVIRPWHTRREFCPREDGWYLLFQRSFVVDNDTLPLEARIIEFMMGKLRAEFQNLLFNGDYGSGDAFDGIFTQIKADSTNFPPLYLDPAAFEPATQTSSVNPIVEFRKLRKNMAGYFNQRAERDTLTWIVPDYWLNSYEDYVFDNRNLYVREDSRRNTLQPENYRLSEFRRFYNIQDQNATPPTTADSLAVYPNTLFLGLSSVEENMSSRLYFDEKDFKLYVTVEGHAGTGISAPWWCKYMSYDPTP